MLVSWAYIIGFYIGFSGWCLVVAGGLSFWLLRRNLSFRVWISLALSRLIDGNQLALKRRLLLNSVGGNQRLPIQFEIFQQNLAMSIRTRLLKLRHLLKINR